MNFNEHWNLKGKHAELSASNCYWLDYDDEKMERVWRNRQNIIRGTKLHDLAAQMIELKELLPNTERTLCAYVNDAIRLNMKAEKLLYYSIHCFGTCDAIKYGKEKDKMVLRIHDLKTGKTKPKRQQLEVYAALFCLEYHVDPKDILIYLRIYQNDEVDEWSPTVERIMRIMDIIVRHSDFLERKDREE